MSGSVGPWYFLHRAYFARRLEETPRPNKAPQGGLRERKGDRSGQMHAQCLGTLPKSKRRARLLPKSKLRAWAPLLAKSKRRRRAPLLRKSQRRARLLPESKRQAPLLPKRKQRAPLLPKSKRRARLLPKASASSFATQEQAAGSLGSPAGSMIIMTTHPLQHQCSLMSLLKCVQERILREHRMMMMMPMMMMDDDGQ